MEKDKEKNKKRVKETAALKYNPTEGKAPKIVALGKGEIGEKIIEKAKENAIPIVENANLAKTLNMLSVGEEIPPELYEIVAEILIFIGNVDKNFGE
ncbi:MAG: EscU/YscU/HrcU family type III secretion system export apparatus switch protein [Clostridiales bacterium]